MAPTAVLLDFDGVIADLENLHVTAWQRTLARLGWELADEAAARSLAVDDHRFAAEIFAQRQIAEADIDGWVAWKRTLTRSMIRHSPRLFPGASALIRGLEGRARLAVVANAARVEVEALLEAAGLADRVDVIVADGDAARDLAADSRLLALSLLDVAPDRAVAVEGSYNGALAALVAGAAVVGVGHRLAAEDWFDDVPLFPGLEPASAILAQLGFTDPGADTGDRATP